MASIVYIISRRTVQLGLTQGVYERFPLQKLFRYTPATQAGLYRGGPLYMYLLYGWNYFICTVLTQKGLKGTFCPTNFCSTSQLFCINNFSLIGVKKCSRNSVCLSFLQNFFIIKLKNTFMLKNSFGEKF